LTEFSSYPCFHCHMGNYVTSYSAETPDQNTGEEDDETSDSRLLMQM